MELTAQKIIVGIIIMLILTAIAAVGGQYVGSMLFANFVNLPENVVGITTLWDYSHSEYMKYAEVSKFVKLGFCGIRIGYSVALVDYGDYSYW